MLFAVHAALSRYVLLHDTDDTERQGLGIRKMYRTLAPQITENPIFMHLTDATPSGIRRAVDQCHEVSTMAACYPTPPCKRGD